MSSSRIRKDAWTSKPVQVYAFALVAVGIATALRLLLRPAFGEAAPYIFFVLPIIAAANYGGFGPGIVASVSSAAILAFTFLGVRTLTPPDAAYLSLFLLDGLCISWLGKRMVKARRDAACARERERAILCSVSDGFASLDENWQLIHANARLAELTGRPLSTLRGQKIHDILPELSQPPARQELERALREQVPVRLDAFLPQSGRWCEISAYPQDRGLSIFSRDVTERKRAEEILRDADERLKLAPDAARVGTWSWDLTNRRIVLSPELEHILGLATGSFTGNEEDLLCLIHPQDSVSVRNAVARAIESRGHYEVEFRYLHTSGETRWMLGRGKVCSSEARSSEARSSEARSAEDAQERVVGIGIDISDQKKSEAKLRHTQKLESLGVLAGGIAHDFNNLLVGIMGNASLAGESLPEGHAASQQLEEIVLASQKATHLTRQMLAYAGKGRFVIERIEISTLIRETERLLRSSLLKTVDLRLELGNSLPCVEGDPGQMQQLIMNLVINAAEAIGEGNPGTVSVRTSLRQIDREFTTQLTAQELPAGNYVALEVEDNGTGMDEVTQAKIFEPFFTTKFVGRGLGLSAVLGIVRGHKGALKVTSSPGRGATFQVLLPAVAQSKSATMPGAADTDLQGSGSVLVVDDEGTVRNLAQAVLRRYGYTVLTAEDAFSAMEVLRRARQKVALVLLDLSMPGMTAKQAIELMQSHWPDTPIVLTSGYDEQEVLAQFAGARLAGFVQKPYMPAQLAGKIKAALARGTTLSAARVAA